MVNKIENAPPKYAALRLAWEAHLLLLAQRYGKMHEARKLFEDIIIIPQEFDKFGTAVRPAEIDRI